MAQADIQMVFAKIAEAARNLRMASDAQEVREAREIAVLAVNDGYGAEDAFQFARSVLVPDSGKMDLVTPFRLSA